MKESKETTLNNKLAKALFTTSIEDLLSARCLYKDGRYPNSIFFLQQSTEKLNKALGLCLDLVDSKNLRKIITILIGSTRKLQKIDLMN